MCVTPGSGKTWTLQRLRGKVPDEQAPSTRHAGPLFSRAVIWVMLVAGISLGHPNILEMLYGASWALRLSDGPRFRDAPQFRTLF